MQGWQVALAMAALTITGCGSGGVEPPRAAVPPQPQVTASPSAATPGRRDAARRAARRAARLRPGVIRTGTYRTRATDASVADEGVREVRTAPVPAVRPTGRRSFIRGHLAALRAHCATGPADPRCDGRRVDVRVALAGLKATR